MKKKVLFYGNCQLAVIANIFNRSSNFLSKYEVLYASEFGIESIWKYDIVFAPFQYFGEKKYTDFVVDSISKAFSMADVIIFQRFNSAHDRPDEITTDYFYDKYSNQKQFICIPSFWFGGYFMNPRELDAQFTDIISYLIYKKNLNNKQILRWFRNGYCPEIEKLKNINVKDSIENMIAKEREDSKIYKNYISIIDIIKEYDRRLICYTHSHPSRYVFNKLIDRISHYLDGYMNYIEVVENDIECVGSTFPFLGDIHFFNKSFPHIKYIQRDRCMFNHNTLNQKYIDNQISNVYKLHMKSWIC